jgi:hypothetical protein
LHNNGRLLDVFWRLHGDEDMFFVPYDLEMSNQELAYVIRKAEQWRGEEGERRKVAVYDYIWEEETVSPSKWHSKFIKLNLCNATIVQHSFHVGLLYFFFVQSILQVEDKVWDASTGVEQKDTKAKEEITTHVAIHTLHLDGLRQLYRHFLRLPDGAICEVFGDIAAAGLNKDINAAVTEQGKKLEKLASSHQDLHQVFSML